MGGVAIVVTYVTASVFFWRNPHLLHRKKWQSFKAMNISHRGGSAEGYENTLKNFKKAMANGTHMLELDVRLTRDGQVVVYHDPDLKRLTGSTSLISELNYAQLPLLNQVIPIDTIPGQTYSDQEWIVEDRKIPLLKQVFEEFPTVPINIDLKDFDTKLITEVSKLIKLHNRANITVWGSFNQQTTTACYNSNPDVGLFFSAKKTLLLCFLTVTGLLPFVPIKETHYEVFLPSSIKKRIHLHKGSLTVSEKFLYWVCNNLLVSKRLIRHLQARGIQVYLWVCNSTEEYRECVELGANGIMTDYPSKLRDFLNDETINLQDD